MPDDLTGLIQETHLKDALSERYLAYALSTIMSRSLPDVRDGLKPVHRRLIYAMHQLRLDPTAGSDDAAAGLVVEDEIESGTACPRGICYLRLVAVVSSVMVDGDGAVPVDGIDKKMAVDGIGDSQRGDLRNRDDAAGNRVELADIHRPQRVSKSRAEDPLIHLQLALDRHLGIDVFPANQHDVQDDGHDDIETKRDPEQSCDDGRGHDMSIRIFVAGQQGPVGGGAVDLGDRIPDPFGDLGCPRIRDL